MQPVRPIDVVVPLRDASAATPGPLVPIDPGELEADLAIFAGAAHAVAVGAGPSALALALHASGVLPGDEVVVPGIAPVLTWLAVRETGAVPVPVDVDVRTGLVDPALVAAAVTPRTRAVVPVHLNGSVADLLNLGAMAEERGLIVVDDASHAHGARLHGRPVGALTGATAWRFAPEAGGAVTTDDPELAERIRGLDGPEPIGGLTAAVLRARIAAEDARTTQCTAVAARYATSLAGLGDLALPYVGAGVRHAWQSYVVRHPRRDEIAEALAADGVETRPARVPPQRHSWFRGTKASAADLPMADLFAATALSLPMGSHLTRAHVDHVVDALRAAMFS